MADQSKGSARVGEALIQAAKCMAYFKAGCRTSRLYKGLGPWGYICYTVRLYRGRGRGNMASGYYRIVREDELDEL